TDRQGPFHANWDSLAAYRIPEWFRDAKFGIFIHWGVYSVPAFGNEWYSRNMYDQDSPDYQHQVAAYGPESKFGYKDFIPKFRAEHFDPAQWVDLFVRAGAKYVVPVAEHCDGFSMYAGLYGPAQPMQLPGEESKKEPDPNHLERWLPPDAAFLRDWLARSTEL